jgi:hypothetical protein
MSCLRVNKKIIFSFSFLALSFLSSDNLKDQSFLQTYQDLKEVVVTPSATPLVDSTYEIYAQGSYILWKPHLGSLNYAQSGIPSIKEATSSNFVQQTGSIYAPNFGCSSGFKLLVGSNFLPDGWGTSLEYTWYGSNANSEYGSEDPLSKKTFETLIDGNFSVLPSGRLDIFSIFPNSSYKGASDWKLRFNNVDLLLHRECFLSRNFLLDPFCGFKGAWMTQHYDVTYQIHGVSIGINGNSIQKNFVVSADETYNIYNKQFFWGIGPEIGTKISWLFSKNFLLTSNFKYSALWSGFKVNREDYSNITDLGTSTKVLYHYHALSTDNKFYQLNSVFESTLGILYQHWFKNNEKLLSLFLGWETQMWMDQNHFLFKSTSGNLSFQGLNFTLKGSF